MWGGDVLTVYAALSLHPFSELGEIPVAFGG